MRASFISSEYKSGCLVLLIRFTFTGACLLNNVSNTLYRTSNELFGSAIVSIILELKALKPFLNTC
jgi:hypothetical protein